MFGVILEELRFGCDRELEPTQASWSRIHDRNAVHGKCVTPLEKQDL